MDPSPDRYTPGPRARPSPATTAGRSRGCGATRLTPLSRLATSTRLVPLTRIAPGPRLARFTLLAASVATLTGCGVRYDAPEPAEDSAATADPATAEDPGADPQLVFWSTLESLCGQAYEGRLVESVPPDPSFDGVRLVMHVRSCDMAEIRIPFFVGDDRSRTWVITPTAAGLRLEHDHRHEDGTEDEISRYGGETQGRGTSTSQDFHADRYTAELVPAAATNVWTLEVDPGRLFAYALRREGSDRRFRVEFDLTVPVPEPAAPW